MQKFIINYLGTNQQHHWNPTQVREKHAIQKNNNLVPC